MAQAASLAAAIEREFGIAVLLKEGHGAIFELTVEGEVVYTNQSKCGVLPQEKEVLDLVEKHTGRDRRRPSGPPRRQAER